MAGDVGSEPTPRVTLATRFHGAAPVADFQRVCAGGIAEAETNETARGAAQSAADGKVYARLAKDLTAVKSDVAHLSQQISEAVNAIGAVAQGQAHRGLRNARANVVSLMTAGSDRAGAVANAAHHAASSVVTPRRA